MKRSVCVLLLPPLLWITSGCGSSDPDQASEAADRAQRACAKVDARNYAAAATLARQAADRSSDFRTLSAATADYVSTATSDRGRSDQPLVQEKLQRIDDLCAVVDE